jgi:hypothetical protein
LSSPHLSELNIMDTDTSQPIDADAPIVLSCAKRFLWSIPDTFTCTQTLDSIVEELSTSISGVASPTTAAAETSNPSIHMIRNESLEESAESLNTQGSSSRELQSDPKRQRLSSCRRLSLSVIPADTSQMDTVSKQGVDVCSITPNEVDSIEKGDNDPSIPASTLENPTPPILIDISSDRVTNENHELNLPLNTQGHTSVQVPTDQKSQRRKSIRRRSSLSTVPVEKSQKNVISKQREDGWLVPHNEPALAEKGDNNPSISVITLENSSPRIPIDIDIVYTERTKESEDSVQLDTMTTCVEGGSQLKSMNTENLPASPILSDQVEEGCDKENLVPAIGSISPNNNNNSSIDNYDNNNTNRNIINKSTAPNPKFLKYTPSVPDENHTISFPLGIP